MSQPEPNTVHNISELGDLLENQPVTGSYQIGQILLEKGYIDENQLAIALGEQKKTKGKRLLELLQEEGYLTPEQSADALANRFHMPYVLLRDFEPDLEALALVPYKLATRFNILPLAFFKDRLVLALPDPTDIDALSSVGFASGYPVEPVVTSPSDIERLTEYFYSNLESREVFEEVQYETEPDLQEGRGLSEARERQQSPEQLERQANELPVVRMVKSLILNGIISGASDIHIHPEKDRIRVAYRIDGKLHFQDNLERHLLDRIISRIKILGRMDIAERRLPQDGQTTIMRSGRPIELRLSIMPTVEGESCVIRILDKEEGLKPLGDLGLAPVNLQQLRDLSTYKQGLLLVTGPTGSGKSTTQYSLLKEVQEWDPHIITVEDPVEYEMEGVTQAQVHDKAGFTFATALRHILRHDPDVILVGEIRDKETAEIAIQAALTGHLVLATLHTNDATSTVTRLEEMGVARYLITGTLLGAMSQRLVRLNCPACTESGVEVSQAVRKAMGAGADEVFYRGLGCPKCGYTGYRGRTIVPEIFIPDNDIREMIGNEATAQQLRRESKEKGMRGLNEAALEVARQGITSLEEAYSIRIT